MTESCAAEPVVFLDGRFLPAGEARVSVMDRGFLFGDGVYEVIPAYAGHLFRLDEHLDRLAASLAAVAIKPPADLDWRTVLPGLVERNGGGDQAVYLQVTRGVQARRNHAFPERPEPTVFAMSSPLPAPPGPEFDGVCAITAADVRWQRNNIKATALLANVLLRQEAVAGGCAEAILIRDGRAVEGAASNLFAVIDGTIVTPPKNALILPGITRDLVVELARRFDLPCEERPVTRAELDRAEEVWLSSSTRELLPVVEIDGEPVGEGRPGKLWRRMMAYYQEYKQHFVASR